MQERGRSGNGQSSKFEQAPAYTMVATQQLPSSCTCRTLDTAQEVPIGSPLLGPMNIAYHPCVARSSTLFGRTFESGFNPGMKNVLTGWQICMCKDGTHLANFERNLKIRATATRVWTYGSKSRYPVFCHLLCPYFCVALPAPHLFQGYPKAIPNALRHATPRPS